MPIVKFAMRIIEFQIRANCFFFHLIFSKLFEVKKYDKIKFEFDQKKRNENDESLGRNV